MSSPFEINLGVYLKSERAMLDILVQDKVRQFFWGGMSLIAFFAALVMLDIGLFFTLITYCSLPNTAFILSGAHAGIFLICLLCGRRKKYRKEVEALREIRDFAKEEVMKDLQVVVSDVKEVGESVQDVVRSASSLFTGEAFSVASVLAAVHHVLKDKK